LVEPVNGSEIYLSLDIDLQQIVEKELEKQLDSSGAINGSAILLDVKTGGVLACATVEVKKRKEPRCRPILDQNEPGSTAKIAPIGTVLQEGIFEPEDKIYVEEGKFRVGAYNIYDDHKYDTLSCNEVGVYSSNIGATKMGLAAGAERIYKTLVQLGVGTKTGIDFPGEASGTISKPGKWNDHALGTICFGYGISLSSLQIAVAYGAIASGGELLKPFFAEKMITSDGDEVVLNRKTVVRYVFDEETIVALQDILKDVVLEGTAKKAQNKIVSIVGKTGTAKRVKKEGKGYDSKRCLASFAGYFPADNPQVVGVIMFDEPESSIYGGEVAAPALREIAVRYASLPKNKMMVENNIENDPFDSRFANADAHNAKIEQAVIKYPLKSDDDYREAERSDVLPDFRGWTVRDAIQTAKINNTEYKIKGSGIIVSQSPKPGTRIEKVKCLTLVGDCK
jgi:cell division protein FtsI (penicillin-binding protein 3)